MELLTILGGIIFLAGMYCWALPIIIQHKKEMKHYLSMMIFFAIISVLISIPDIVARKFDIMAVIFGIILLSLIFIVAFLKEYLIPIINEKIIFLSNMVFLYLLYSRILNESSLITLLLIPHIIMSIYSLVLISLKFKIKVPLKVLTFLWYLIILLTTAIYNVSDGVIFDIDTYIYSHMHIVSFQQIPELFFTGMFAMFVFCNLLIVFMLIPGKNSTVKDVKENWQFVASRINDEQFILKDWLIVIGLLGIIGLNHFMNIHPILFANTLLILIPYFIKPKESNNNIKKIKK